MRNILLRSLVCMLLSVMLYSTHAQTTAALQPQGDEWNNAMLVAKWKTGDMIFDLKKDGSSMVTINGRECPGTWAVKDNKVTITPKRLKWKNGDPCSQPRTLQVINVTAEGMDISGAATGQEIHLVKQQ
jgi:hypothetical protein